jgi:hypothetical protein
MLAKSFHSVVQSVNNMITDIEKMHQHHENGEMSYHIDTSGYQGAYKNVAAGVDETIHSYVAMIGDIFGALESFGQGDDGFVFQAVKNAALRSKILAQAAKASP